MKETKNKHTFSSNMGHCSHPQKWFHKSTGGSLVVSMDSCQMGDGFKVGIERSQHTPWEMVWKQE